METKIRRHAATQAGFLL